MILDVASILLLGPQLLSCYHLGHQRRSYRNKKCLSYGIRSNSSILRPEKVQQFCSTAPSLRFSQGAQQPISSYFLQSKIPPR